MMVHTGRAGVPSYRLQKLDTVSFGRDPEIPVARFVEPYQFRKESWSIAISAPIQHSYVINRNRAFYESFECVTDYLCCFIPNGLYMDPSDFGGQVMMHLLLEMLMQANGYPPPAIAQHNPMHVKSVIYGHICNGALIAEF